MFRIQHIIVTSFQNVPIKPTPPFESPSCDIPFGAILTNMGAIMFDKSYKPKATTLNFELWTKHTAPFSVIAVIIGGNFLFFTN